MAVDVCEEIMRTEGIDLHSGVKMLIIDAGCLFPYVNKEVLDFEIGLLDYMPDGKADVPLTFGDVKRNFRYSGQRDYVTISKVYSGNKVSKLGYPVVIDDSRVHNGFFTCILVVKFGINGDDFVLLHPLEVDFSQNNVANISAMSFFDPENSFSFMLHTHKWSEEDNGWLMASYASGNCRAQLPDFMPIEYCPLCMVDYTAVAKRPVLVIACPADRAFSW